MVVTQTIRAVSEGLGGGCLDLKMSGNPSTRDERKGSLLTEAAQGKGGERQRDSGKSIAKKTWQNPINYIFSNSIQPCIQTQLLFVGVTFPTK